MDIYFDEFGNKHRCRTYKTFACDAAVEDEVTGVIVCRFSGKQFGFSAIVNNNNTEEEVEEQHLVPKEEDVVVKKINQVEFQAFIRQVVSSEFPVVAYAMELVRLYTKYNMQKYFTNIEEYVVSTLYLMSEGFGEICEQNQFVAQHIVQQSELKTVKINKTIITSGNKNWQRVCRDETPVSQQTSSHLFSFKKQKINTITINPHEEIMRVYNKLKRKQNKYLIDL